MNHFVAAICDCRRRATVYRRARSPVDRRREAILAEKNAITSMSSSSCWQRRGQTRLTRDRLNAAGLHGDIVEPADWRVR